MKLINIYIGGATGVLTLGLLASCAKTQKDSFANENNFSNTSQVQLYLATVNATRNYLYVDALPVTGSTMGSGSLFPSGAYASTIQGGVRSFLVRDTSSAITATQVPLSFAENMQVGRNYTIFMYDSINAPKQKTVLTNILIPSDTTARIRFANFVYSVNAIPAIDIYSTRSKANVATNLQITDITDFVRYDSTGLPDTFYVRTTGTANNINNITPTTATPPSVLTPIRLIFTPARKRSYTVVFRGSYATVLTTAAQVKTLSVFTNY